MVYPSCWNIIFFSVSTFLLISISNTTFYLWLINILLTITVIDLVTFLSEVYTITLLPSNLAWTMLTFSTSTYYFFYYFSYFFYSFYSDSFSSLLVSAMTSINFFYTFESSWLFLELLLSPSELNKSGSNTNDYFFYGNESIFCDKVLR